MNEASFWKCYQRQLIESHRNVNSKMPNIISQFFLLLNFKSHFDVAKNATSVPSKKFLKTGIFLHIFPSPKNGFRKLEAFLVILKHFKTFQSPYKCTLKSTKNAKNPRGNFVSSLSILESKHRLLLLWWRDKMMHSVLWHALKRLVSTIGGIF